MQFLKKLIHSPVELELAETPDSTLISPPASPRIIHSLEDLDRELEAVDTAFLVSDSAGRQRLAEFYFQINTQFPEDPYSPEYMDAQMALYCNLSGRATYDPHLNEQTPFDIDDATARPYPYGTADARSVGEQLIAQGFLIRCMNLAPRSNILEFGPGWGNTTLHFAQMGYQVSAVEIEPRFIELIKRRSAQLGVSVELFQSDMLTFQTDRKYDAVVFFESFHHCTNHLQLLTNLKSMLTPDGIIAFGAEPITPAPHPWGLIRGDGLTIWSIRKMGWFELGFSYDYFLRTLLLWGWLPEYHASDICFGASVYIARQSTGFYDLTTLTLPGDEAATWWDQEPTHRFTKQRSVLSCDRSRPVAAVEICLSNPAPLPVVLTLTIAGQAHTLEIPAFTERQQLVVPTPRWEGQVVFTSATWRPSEVLKYNDNRQLGVAVHWLQLTYA